MLIKFLGFLLFAGMAFCGFWLLTFLISFLPVWLIGQSSESLGYVNKDVEAKPLREPLSILYKKD